MHPDTFLMDLLVVITKSEMPEKVILKKNFAKEVCPMCWHLRKPHDYVVFLFHYCITGLIMQFCTFNQKGKYFLIKGQYQFLLARYNVIHW